jgi:hypothetical protein
MRQEAEAHGNIITYRICAVSLTTVTMVSQLCYSPEEKGKVPYSLNIVWWPQSFRCAENLVSPHRRCVRKSASGEVRLRRAKRGDKIRVVCCKTADPSGRAV